MIGLGSGIGLGLNTPMGGSGESDPALPAVSTGTLQFHVKANVGLFDASVGGNNVTELGGLVGRWEDQSGNGRHLLQATAGSRPTLVKNQINSRGVVRYNGTTNTMSTTVQVPTGAFTAFSVTKLQGSGGGGILYEACNGDLAASGNGFWLLGTTAHTTIARNAPSGNASAWDMSAANWAFDNAAKLVVQRMDGTHLGHQCWVNKILQVMTPKIAVNPGTGSSSNLFHLGSRRTGTNKCTGDFCEMLIYNGALDATDRGNVEDYLRSKWATP